MKRHALMAALMAAAVSQLAQPEQFSNHQRPWPVPKKPQTKNQSKAQRRKGKKK